MAERHQTGAIGRLQPVDERFAGGDESRVARALDTLAGVESENGLDRDFVRVDYLDALADAIVPQLEVASLKAWHWPGSVGYEDVDAYSERPSREDLALCVNRSRQEQRESGHTDAPLCGRGPTSLAVPGPTTIAHQPECTGSGRGRTASTHH
jgi:hypothetical protein